MARTYVQFTGAEQVIENLKKLEGDIFPNTAVMIERSLKPVEAKMKSNAATLFNKGYSKGVMVNSIGINVDYKKMQAYNKVAGSVGVFDVSETGVGDYGTVGGRRITAPMLALFYETGIQPHSTAKGSRAERRQTESSRARPAIISDEHVALNNKRKEQNKNEIKLHPGSAPVPFISSAGESMMPNIMQQMDKEVEKMIGDAL